MESGDPSPLPPGTASLDQGLLRLLATHVSAIFWTADRELKIRTLAGGGLAVFGVKPEEGVGRTLFEYFGTQDPKYPGIAAHLGALEGRAGDYEVEYRGRTFYSRVEPLRNGGGEVTGVIGLGLDLTETVRARKDLRESEERFRSVFERSPVGMGIAIRGTLRYANPALVRLFRCDGPEELLGKSVLSHIAPRCQDEIRRRIADREAGRPWSNSFQTVGIRKDGTEFVYQLEVGRILLPEGEASLAFATDVTDRVRSEESLQKYREELEHRVGERTAELASTNAELLREIDERKRSQAALASSEAQFRDLAENIRGVFWLIDAVTRDVLYVSPGYAEIWGRSCESLYRNRHSWVEAIHPEDRERILRAQPPSRGGGAYDEEYRIVLPDGRVRWIHDRAFPVRDTSGAIYRIAGIAEDVTERKRLEAEIRDAVHRSERAYRDLQATQSQLVRSGKLASIGMLVSGVAHEINNPLNVMYGNLKLLEERSRSVAGRKGRAARGKKARSPSAEVKKTRSMLRDALRAAERARDIITTFRDFARDTRLAEEVDLNLCLEKTVAVVRRQVPASIALKRQLRAIPKVRCFPGQLSQVFFNLLQNAVEAIDRKGRIVLRSGKQGDYVVVEVEDNGRGMSADVKERVFEPFFTTKEVGRGLGLGLAVSAMIVQNHGGEIRVESIAGKGSIFQVYLPFRRPAGPLPESARSPSPRA